MVATSSDTATYIIARMAQWAGDLNEAMRLYDAFAGGETHRRSQHRLPGPLEMMKYAAALRSQQIRQRIEEFEIMTRELHLGELTYQPHILETRHLRGAVWRLGPRWFQMRAYLSDLEHETDLLERARHLAIDNNGIGVGSGGMTWAVSGNPFSTVSVTERCLIVADAHWAKQGFPTDDSAFVKKLTRVLFSLDIG